MRRSTADVADEVTTLAGLSRENLAGLWQKAHGHPPPKGIRRELLMRSAAWHLQAARLGGLSAETRRVLRSAISAIEFKRSRRAEANIGLGKADEGAMSAKRVSRQKLLPGARLIRDWNGKTHIVDVIEDGFVFQAKVHKSLTAIAYQITGAHWSGPRFFGR